MPFNCGARAALGNCLIPSRRPLPSAAPAPPRPGSPSAASPPREGSVRTRKAPLALALSGKTGAAAPGSAPQRCGRGDAAAALPPAGRDHREVRAAGARPSSSMSAFPPRPSRPRHKTNWEATRGAGREHGEPAAACRETARLLGLVGVV